MGNSSSSVPRKEILRCLYSENETEELYKKYICSSVSSVQLLDSSHNPVCPPSKMIDLLASQVGEALPASFFDKRLQLLAIGQSGVSLKLLTLKLQLSPKPKSTKAQEMPEEAKNAIREQLDLDLNQDALAAVMLLSSVLHFTKESYPVLCSCLFEHPVINSM